MSDNLIPEEYQELEPTKGWSDPGWAVPQVDPEAAGRESVSDPEAAHEQALNQLVETANQAATARAQAEREYEEAVQTRKPSQEVEVLRRKQIEARDAYLSAVQEFKNLDRRPLYFHDTEALEQRVEAAREAALDAEDERVIGERQGFLTDHLKEKATRKAREAQQTLSHLENELLARKQAIQLATRAHARDAEAATDDPNKVGTMARLYQIGFNEWNAEKRRERKAEEFEKIEAERAVAYEAAAAAREQTYADTQQEYKDRIISNSNYKRYVKGLKS